MGARQIGHLKFSEAPGRAARDTWLVLVAGEEAPLSAKSSSEAILLCKPKR